MSFAPKIAMVVNNHSLLAIRTSDVVKGNISVYLLNNETAHDQGVDIDRLSLQCSGGSRWEVDQMTGSLVFVTYDLHVDAVVVAVLWVYQHNVSLVDVGE